MQRNAVDGDSAGIHLAVFHGKEGHFMRVLVVEDDEATASSIDLMLQSQDFNVYTTDLGEEAIDLGLLYAYDIILLDLGLPDMSGYEVLRALRARNVRTPVLIVSAMSSENEAVWRAFGAQDFLRKPFHMDDMVARIHAVAGGAGYDRGQALVTGGLSLNLIERTAMLNGTALDLTGKEYDLLELLQLSEGEAVTRQHFACHLYGGVLEGPDLGVIDVFMGRLRAKLDNASPGHTYVQRSLQDYVLRGPLRGGAGRAAVSARREELLRRLMITASKIKDTDLKPPVPDRVWPPIQDGSPFAALERAWAANRRLARQQWPGSSPLAEIVAAELGGNGKPRTKTAEEILELLSKAIPLPA